MDTFAARLAPQHPVHELDPLPRRRTAEAAHHLTPIDLDEELSTRSSFGGPGVDLESFDDVFGIARVHLYHPFEAASREEGRPQCIRIAGRADHQALLGGDRAIDEVEHEIHDRPDR